MLIVCVRRSWNLVSKFYFEIGMSWAPTLPKLYILSPFFVVYNIYAQTIFMQIRKCVIIVKFNFCSVHLHIELCDISKWSKSTWSTSNGKYSHTYCQNNGTAQL